MKPGQWKTRFGVVVKTGASPHSCRVTQCAVLGETCRNVIGIPCIVEGAYMASGTGLRCSREPAVDMTCAAGRTDVGARQRKAGGRIVVELCAQPVAGRMTGGARCRETCRSMIRTLCRRKVTRMARIAIRARPGKNIVHMATRAGNCRMGAG